MGARFSGLVMVAGLLATIGGVGEACYSGATAGLLRGTGKRMRHVRLAAGGRWVRRRCRR
jgi:hypothetical protein